MTRPSRGPIVKAALAAGKLALLLLGFATAGEAQRERFSQEELLALPRACLAQTFISKSLTTAVVPEQEREQWYATLGESYKHYHHFCWGLIYMRRAVTSGNHEHNYRSAAGNFEYVIRNATRDFPLLPEVHLRKGLALRHLREDAAAAAEFVNALELKPDYTPAYAALMDVHLDSGDLEGAEAVLAMGLEHAPNSKILAEKRAELDSRRTDP